MAREKNTEMPNLFVIGAMKCGTTSLHHYLDLHPEISMSREKEPCYFVSPAPDGFRHRVGDRDAYLDLFEAGTRYRGETSTRYTRFPLHKGIPAAIASEVPEARLIYLVRDPVERVEAQGREVLSARLDDAKHLPDDIQLADLVGDVGDSPNEFLDPGRYMMQIREYLNHFPSKSLLVLDSDDLKFDRRETMARIFGFLGLEEGFWDDRMASERNTAADKKRRTELYVDLSEIRPLKSLVDRMPHGMRREVIALARTYLSRPWQPPRLDDELRSRLEALYRPEVEELRGFTGQDFPGWSI